MHQPCLAAALDYVSRGWSAIPLCPHDHSQIPQLHIDSCKSPGKAPLVPWKAYQERLAKPAELTLYFHRHPTANVGIALGPVSNLMGLDIDGDEGHDLLDELCDDGELPETLEFQTPGGGHRLLFLWPDFEITSKSIKRKGKEAIRILARGSQTVAPPSTHITGGKYAWAFKHGPKDLKPAPCPEWLIKHLVKADDQPPPAKLPTPITIDNDSHSPAHRAMLYLSKCDAAVSGGGGHAQTYKVACKVAKGFGLDEEQAFDLLWTHYNPRCQPPWTEKELRHKVKDAMKSAGPTGYLLGEPTKPSPIPTLPHGPTAVTRNFQTVATKPVEWLWPKWLPLGKLSILDGDPGLGKSTMLLDLAARISTTGVMPDKSLGITGNVILMSAEDAPEDTIRPRLEAAQANLHRVHDLSVIRKGTEDRPPEIPSDLHLIEQRIADLEARLLVIDPLMAFLYGADANKDQEIRRVLFKLSRIAEKQRCAIICMRHLNKGGGTKAIYRGNSSIGVIGHARVGLLVAEDPDDDKQRILAVSKCNLALKPKSLRFALDPVGDVCRIGWNGTSSYVADQLVAPPSTAEDKAKQEDVHTKTLQCAELLTSILGQGPVQVKELKKELIDAGFSHATIERAAKQINVVFWPALENGKRNYWWRLPDSPGA